MVRANDYYPIFAREKSSGMLIINIRQASPKFDAPFCDIILVEAKYFLPIFRND